MVNGTKLNPNSTAPLLVLKLYYNETAMHLLSFLSVPSNFLTKYRSFLLPADSTFLKFIVHNLCFLSE